MRLSEIRYRIGTERRDRSRALSYRQFVRPGDLVFDIGAHVGDRTRLLLRAGARVVAVEPHPRLIGKLQRAFGRDTRVTLVGEAVGAEPGEAELRWPHGSLGLASMSEEWVARVQESGRFDAEWEDAATVSVTTLDELIAAHGLPSFCKIDVEGYEVEVLRGLSRPIDAVAIEFTPEYLESTERALERLEEIGEYRFNHSIGEVFGLAEAEWWSSNELLSRLREYEGDTFGDVYARRTR